MCREAPRRAHEWARRVPPIDRDPLAVRRACDRRFPAPAPDARRSVRLRKYAIFLPPVRQEPPISPRTLIPRPLRVPISRGSNVPRSLLWPRAALRVPISRGTFLVRALIASIARGAFLPRAPAEADDRSSGCPWDGPPAGARWREGREARGSGVDRRVDIPWDVRRTGATYVETRGRCASSVDRPFDCPAEALPTVSPCSSTPWDATPTGRRPASGPCS
jgi:hypothetical protein